MQFLLNPEITLDHELALVYPSFQKPGMSVHFYYAILNSSVLNYCMLKSAEKFNESTVI